MKPVILIPIIVGGVLLVTGGAMLGIAIAQNSKTNVITRDENLDDQTFTNFKFECDVSDIEFKVSPDGKKKVTFTEEKKLVHEYTVSDNTLVIKQKDTRKWYEHILSFSGLHMKSTIYLPAAAYGNIDVKNATGDLVVPSDFTFENITAKQSTGNMDIKAKVNDSLDLQASTGNIKLLNMDPKSVTLKASTGNFYLENLNVEGDININMPDGGSTGSVTLTNVTSNNLSVRTSTGDMKLTNVVVTNKIYLKASTGDIKLNDVDAHEIEIKTSTGDIKGTLLTGKIFSVKSGTSRPSVPQSVEGHGTCSLDTNTGKIVITIKA